MLSLAVVPAVCQDPTSSVGGRDRRDRPPRRDSRSPPPRRGRNDDDSYRRGRRADGQAVDGRAASSEQCLPSARTLPLVVGERTARHLSRYMYVFSPDRFLEVDGLVLIECSLLRFFGDIPMLSVNLNSVNLNAPEIETDEGNLSYSATWAVMVHEAETGFLSWRLSVP